jgi:segregation and condensation protein A
MLAVKTPVFEGALDLLLHLIESEDLDITAVSLVQVTDQYLVALRAADQIDLRAMADFIVVGAKLVFLKSRALLPRTPEQVAADDMETEAIAFDLTAQLEEYRNFKAAAGYLHNLEDEGHRSFARTAAPPTEWLPSGIERVTMKKLLAALSRAMERLPSTPAPHRMERAVINVAERRAHVMSFVRRRGSGSFLRLISECTSRLEAIVTFLAILDLLKSDELRAEQEDNFGDILLHLPGHTGNAEQPATA